MEKPKEDIAKTDMIETHTGDEHKEECIKETKKRERDKENGAKLHE